MPLLRITRRLGKSISGERVNTLRQRRSPTINRVDLRPPPQLLLLLQQQKPSQLQMGPRVVVNRITLHSGPNTTENWPNTRKLTGVAAPTRAVPATKEAQLGKLLLVGCFYSTLCSIIPILLTVPHKHILKYKPEKLPSPKTFVSPLLKKNFMLCFIVNLSPRIHDTPILFIDCFKCRPPL